MDDFGKKSSSWAWVAWLFSALDRGIQGGIWCA
jgi:hypothetical protein